MKGRQRSRIATGSLAVEAKWRDWDRRFNAAVKRSHALFKEWLRKKGIRAERLKEADLERIVRGARGPRDRWIL